MSHGITRKTQKKNRVLEKLRVCHLEHSERSNCVQVLCCVQNDEFAKHRVLNFPSVISVCFRGSFPRSAADSHHVFAGIQRNILRHSMAAPFQIRRVAKGLREFFIVAAVAQNRAHIGFCVLMQARTQTAFGCQGDQATARPCDLSTPPNRDFLEAPLAWREVRS